MAMCLVCIESVTSFKLSIYPEPIRPGTKRVIAGFAFLALWGSISPLHQGVTVLFPVITFPSQTNQPFSIFIGLRCFVIVSGALKSISSTVFTPFEDIGIGFL